jgi:hypothetical protein
LGTNSRKKAQETQKKADFAQKEAKDTKTEYFTEVNEGNEGVTQ